jgi:hypothetical protein
MPWRIGSGSKRRQQGTPIVFTPFMIAIVWRFSRERGDR